MMFLFIFGILSIIHGILGLRHVSLVRKRGWYVNVKRYTFEVSIVKGEDATRLDWFDLIFYRCSIGFGIILILINWYLLSK